MGSLILSDTSYILQIYNAFSGKTKRVVISDQEKEIKAVIINALHRRELTYLPGAELTVSEQIRMFRRDWSTDEVEHISNSLLNGSLVRAAFTQFK